MSGPTRIPINEYNTKELLAELDRRDTERAKMNSREDKSLPHPADLGSFNPASTEPVWYLSHPLAPDDRMSFQDNMNDVIDIMRICYEEGIRVIAPYHTICLALDDANDEHRRIGLEVDCAVAAMLGRIVLSGHKLSKGMECELNAAMSNKKGAVLDLRNMTAEQMRDAIRKYRHG